MNERSVTAHYFSNMTIPCPFHDMTTLTLFFEKARCARRNYFGNPIKNALFAKMRQAVRHYL